tara:strand:- start:2407 stop:3039 length:633 start_codon:yes stop_codon:yes gene_type:complete
MRSGFSLVEVLVAVLVFAIAGGMGLALLSGSLTSRDTLQQRQDALARLDTTRILLRDDLGQLAMRATRTGDGRTTDIVFAGAQDGVAIWRAPSRDERIILALTRRGWANPGGLAPRGSLQRVEYLLTSEGLERRVTAYPDAVEQTPVTTRLLVPGAGSASVDFLYGDQWRARGAVSTQAGGDRGPQAVRLRYALPPLGDVEHVVLVGGPS